MLKITKQYEDNKNVNEMIDYLNSIIERLEITVEVNGAGTYLVVPVNCLDKKTNKNVLQCKQYKKGKILLTVKGYKRTDGRQYYKDNKDDEQWTFRDVSELKERNIEAYVIDTYNLLSENKYIESKSSICSEDKDNAKISKFTNNDSEEIQSIEDEFNIISEELNNLPKYRTALVKQRIGQGKWRDFLIKKHGCKCALCDINMKELLIASHIKEFSECNEEQGEQLDIKNGLILCANHDKLFDSHLISFDNNGRILISDGINKESYEALCIKESLEIACRLFDEKYMAYHREKLQSK